MDFIIEDWGLGSVPNNLKKINNIFKKNYYLLNLLY